MPVMLASPAGAMINVVAADPAGLGWLQFLLGTEGLNVGTFRSVAALLRDGASDDADCFVIDYKMPNMNGLDLATRLRSRDVSAPIILITGYLDESLPDRAAAAGVLYVLRKPHLEESLLGQIRGVLA